MASELEPDEKLREGGRERGREGERGREREREREIKIVCTAYRYME